MSAMLAQRLLKKRVVVTAAGAGIGRAIAQRLHAEGAQVVGCDVDGAAIDALARDIDIVPFTVDVSSEAAVAAMFADVARRFGGLDGVVNSAGVAGEAGAVTELRVDRWRDLFAVNVEGPMVCIKHAVPLLRAPKPAGLAAGGAIVNISSTGGGLTGYPHRAPYAASKAALNGLTSTLAMELGPEKIRVNTLCPGLIAGDRCDAVVKLTADASGVAESAVRATWQAQNMMRSFLDAEDIAAYVSFLLSDDAKFVTNQNICVDAGTTSLDNLDDYEALVPKARDEDRSEAA